jgi:hypothetical protein
LLDVDRAQDAPRATRPSAVEKQMTKWPYLATALLAAAVAGCDDDEITNEVPPGPRVQLITASGDISAAVTQFRTLLGDPRNGGNVPPATSGRREINWDGVPSSLDNRNGAFPSDFFNVNVPLGASMNASTQGFRNDSSRFRDLDAENPGQFETFSAPKLFAPVAVNAFGVRFFVPGTPTLALVRGFGAVFSDVDLPDHTRIEFYNAADEMILSVPVPPRTDSSSLSFAGAYFPEAVVARVRLTLGTAAVTVNARDLSVGGDEDLVVVDDLLYTEPQPRPVP